MWIISCHLNGQRSWHGFTPETRVQSFVYVVSFSRSDIVIDCTRKSCQGIRTSSSGRNAKSSLCMAVSGTVTTTAPLHDFQSPGQISGFRNSKETERETKRIEESLFGTVGKS